MDAIKVGIAGLGTIGKVVARKLANGEVPGIELDCVAQRRNAARVVLRQDQHVAKQEIAAPIARGELS